MSKNHTVSGLGRLIGMYRGHVSRPWRRAAVTASWTSGMFAVAMFAMAVMSDRALTAKFPPTIAILVAGMWTFLFLFLGALHNLARRWKFEIWEHGIKGRSGLGLWRTLEWTEITKAQYYVQAGFRSIVVNPARPFKSVWIAWPIDHADKCVQDLQTHAGPEHPLTREVLLFLPHA